MRIGMSLAMLFLCLALPGREVHVSLGGYDAADGTWRQATLRASVEAGTESLDVRMINRGDGTVWVDDAALVGIVRGLEPRNPGLAVAPSVAVPVSENIERQGR